MPQIQKKFSELPVSIQRTLQLAIDQVKPTEIILFGSRARGTARENSDYDIVFKIKPEFQKNWTKFLVEIEEKTYSLLKMDLVNYDELDDSYKSEIKKEGCPLYV